MSAERWQKVETILQAALDIEPGEGRARFVSDACAGDEELRREVERLVAAADDAGSFIEAPPWTAGGLFAHADGEESRAPRGGDGFVGRRVGVFELKREAPDAAQSPPPEPLARWFIRLGSDG